MTLKLFSIFAKRSYFDNLTEWVTRKTARLNILLNKPVTGTNVKDLANSWIDLMPPDGSSNFKVDMITNDTAYTEIHLHCPLRGTGNVEACYKLMNYDRQLMSAIGGDLVVLESQSNSGKGFCRLAIRKKGSGTDDLIPAHIKAVQS
ncbi:hypothetical protein [Croceivirga thetidis]|nr:hypothetical protein [Croceivirga thetidis]